MEAADLEERVKTQRLIAEMMEEALDAYHRRLVALSGKDLIEVLTFLILKYRELRALKEGRWRASSIFIM